MRADAALDVDVDVVRSRRLTAAERRAEGAVGRRGSPSNTLIRRPNARSGAFMGWPAYPAQIRPDTRMGCLRLGLRNF
jgi:hypothetical protein